jgi:diaminohydroxyphosphoribosylaminopyrimidine deaminase/5-amino-6-(5-phosphoribosylamino)uracil reductase
MALALNPDSGHHLFMERCIELAQKGAGYVAPNPMVGAVLVHDGKIIGEGYHQRYGEAHAEVNCIADVKEEHAGLISQSTMFVSLEPCAHHGKTPPCADLIIKHRIPKVVIGIRDPFTKVDGKGIEKLKNAGVEIVLGVMAEECRELNKRFLTFHLHQRPYVILKWAQTGNGKIATPGDQRLLITNEYTNRLVHRWRSEEAAIMIGTNTAALDNPELTTRLWDGPSPVRVILDRHLRLPSTLNIFNQQTRTIILNISKQEEKENLLYYKLSAEQPIISQVLEALYKMNLQSIIVEGGAYLLQSFIDVNAWDEARIITNKSMIIQGGMLSPEPGQAIKVQELNLGNDLIETYHPAITL